jgi:hypothetical protein
VKNFHCDNQPAASVLLIFQFPQGHAAPTKKKMKTRKNKAAVTAASEKQKLKKIILL